MKYNVTGIHHITACAGGAQQDIDFFTQIVGLRMVKQTVLMDGTIPIYHLYYANAKAEPGSVMTTFPYGQKTGRQGSGQISATAYSAPKGSLPFWKEHFDKHKIQHGGIQERFGQKYIRFQHPAGLAFEIIEASVPALPKGLPGAARISLSPGGAPNGLPSSRLPSALR